MEESTEKNGIFNAIISAMADIEPIAKGQKNEKQGFSFRGIDVIMNELQPILKKHGLFIVPNVAQITRSERATNSGSVLLYSVVKMEYKMYARDGSFIVGSTVGEGMDSGDKASNKAMSVALKYFLLQTFCIPTDDAKDPDADSYGGIISEFDKLKKELTFHINAGNFNHPENVEKVIKDRDIDQMKKALESAKNKK